MFVNPRFIPFLKSVSVAALFIVAPFAGKFDAAGRMMFASATASAQDVPGPFPPPPDCEGDCGPPSAPDEPPTDPDEPTTEPDEPTIEPIDVPVNECDLTDASDSCFEPEPVVEASTSDDRDEVPLSLPVQPPVDIATAKEKGLEFAQSLRCQTKCTAEVAADGDVSVTLTSTTAEGDEVKTKIIQDGPTVETTVAVNETPITEVKEAFESKESAQAVVAERTAKVVVTLRLSGNLWDDTFADLRPKEEVLSALKEDISEFLDVAAEFITVLNETYG